MVLETLICKTLIDVSAQFGILLKRKTQNIDPAITRLDFQSIKWATVNGRTRFGQPESTNVFVESTTNSPPGWAKLLKANALPAEPVLKAKAPNSIDRTQWGSASFNTQNKT